MRKSILLLAIGIASCPLAMAAPANVVPFSDLAQMPASPPLTYKKLDDQDALNNLMRTNPRHYAIARRILAAATEICDATKGEPVPIKFDAKYIVCARSIWLTSLPPKRALQFRIDDTVYSALVTVANLHPWFDPRMPLRPAPQTPTPQ
jgi:hypothetical protein